MTDCFNFYPFCFQLVADLKRLGAVIVHATLSKIIICTKKRNDADAATYVEFVLQTINKKDLFSPLDITVRQTWRVLLWLDPVRESFRRPCI